MKFTMDKETFGALTIVVGALMKRTDNTGNLDNALTDVVGWMDEVRKEFYE
jgi:hypothetical protein